VNSQASWKTARREPSRPYNVVGCSRGDGSAARVPGSERLLGVEDGDPNSQEGLHRVTVPGHLLFLDHVLATIALTADSASAVEMGWPAR
jgi:hypothetical protein